MQEQDGLNAEQQELELALRSLSPVTARLDPFAAAFAAGLRVRQRQVRVLSVVSVLLLCISSAMFWMHPNRTAAPQQIAQVIQPLPINNSSSKLVLNEPGPQNGPSLMALEKALETHGLDGLPTTHVPDTRAINVNHPL